jgi:hypothetical protein
MVDVMFSLLLVIGFVFFMSVVGVFFGLDPYLLPCLSFVLMSFVLMVVE